MRTYHQTNQKKRMIMLKIKLHRLGFGGRKIFKPLSTLFMRCQCSCPMLRMSNGRLLQWHVSEWGLDTLSFTRVWNFVTLCGCSFEQFLFIVCESIDEMQRERDSGIDKRHVYTGYRTWNHVFWYGNVQWRWYHEWFKSCSPLWNTQFRWSNHENFRYY